LIFSGLLAVVGLLGIFLAWRTVSATRDAAEAALLNAQAVINAERASLLFTTKKVSAYRNYGGWIFQIYAKNFGKVPARRVSIGTPTEIFTAFPDNLLEPPTDSGVDEILEYLAPDDSILVAEFCPSKPEHINERMQAIQSEGVVLSDVRAIIFGLLSYSDGISSEIRHSRYCYRHEREPFSNIGGSIVSCGPRSYTECT
jgi:hypothetical protein